MAHFLRFIEAFIPDSVPEDSRTRQPMRFMIGFMIAITGCCFLYQLLYRQVGNPVGANAIVLEGLLAPSLLVLIRVRGEIRLAAEIFCFSFVVLTTALCLTMGGLTLIGLMPLLWGLTIPQAALLTLGRRSAGVWVVFVAASITAVCVFEATGTSSDWPVMLDEGPHFLFVWAHLVGLGFMFSALGWLFNAAHRGALSVANEARRAAEAMALRLYEEKAGVEEAIRQATEASMAREGILSAAVERMLEGIRDFARGDLTVRLSQESEGDMSELASGFNSATGALQRLLGEVNDKAAFVARSAGDIDHSIRAVASSTQEQAAELQMVSDSVEGMTERVTGNAERAQETATLAERSRDVARDGGEVVEASLGRFGDIARVVAESADTVARLSRRTEEIEGVVRTINRIAHQTHMLALNASIEAARAGAHGQGFAVVADEVKQLADRTADATRQIADAASEIREEATRAAESMLHGRAQVDEGMRLSDKAKIALGRIVDENERVVSLVAQIASVSYEQAEASGEIRTRVLRIADSAAGAATSIGDIAYAAQEMHQITGDLDARIGEFKIRSG